jgi:hypothetical protein
MLEKLKMFETQDLYAIYGKGVIVTIDTNETDVD